MNLLQIVKNRKIDTLFILLFILLAVVPLIVFAARTMHPPTVIQNNDALPTNQPTVPEVVRDEDETTDTRTTLLERKQNRKPLSAQDAQVRSELLQLLPAGQKAGIIYETPSYRVDYVEALDLFKVEILSTDIQSAKTQGYEWFLSQGMSQQGICDLPLQFYLNYSVTQQLPDARSTFNPLPEAC